MNGLHVRSVFLWVVAIMFAGILGARPASDTCEAVAVFQGLSAEPPWLLVCIDPCTQDCEHTIPVIIGPDTVASTCVCYGGSVDPDEMCCRLFVYFIDGEPIAPIGIGDCGTEQCESGEYCTTYWFDQETVRATCEFY